MKTLYVFENDMDVEYYETELEALKAAKYAWNHLSVFERNKLNYFMVYEIAVEEVEPIPFDGDPLKLATRKIMEFKEDDLYILFSDYINIIEELGNLRASQGDVTK